MSTSIATGIFASALDNTVRGTEKLCWAILRRAAWVSDKEAQSILADLQKFGLLDREHLDELRSKILGKKNS